MEITQISTQIFVIGVIIIQAFLFSKKETDVLTWSILIALSAWFLTAWAFPAESSAESFSLLGFLPFQTIIYLICMDIIIRRIKEEKVFQYFAVKIIHATKSNPRAFFYFISFACSISSAFMEDVSVSVIFVPLVIRAAKILKINSKPYILGIMYSVSIGNIISPFSCPINILIADYLGLSFSWFFSRFILLYLVLQIGTLVIIDIFFLQRQSPPTAQQKAILLDIMDPNLLIIEKKRFYRHVIYFITIIISLAFIAQSYLVALIAMVIILLFENQKLMRLLGKVDFELPIFFISLFVLIACLNINGTIEIFSNWLSILETLPVIVGLMIILVATTLIGSFVSKTLAAIVFIAIFQDLFTSSIISPEQQELFNIILIIGADLTGNLLPQSSSHVLKTLRICSENKVDWVDYRKMTQMTFVFSSILFIVGLIYTSLYYIL